MKCYVNLGSILGHINQSQDYDMFLESEIVSFIYLVKQVLHFVGVRPSLIYCS